MRKITSKCCLLLVLFSIIFLSGGNPYIINLDNAGSFLKPNSAYASSTEATYAYAQTYEAEAVANILVGNAGISNCSSCSGGKKVGNLYQGASLQFNEIHASEAGAYNIIVSYLSGDPRAFEISVNGGPSQNYAFEKLADWNTVGTQTVTVQLAKGDNTILFADGGQYSPDIDKIVVLPINQSYEAEASGNILTGHAGIGDCTYCSGEKKVGNLYQGSSVLFNGITASVYGVYKVSVFYISGDPRTAELSVNGGEAQHITFEKTADWSTIGSMDMLLPLIPGDNTLLFSDGGQYSPDIDRIVVTPVSQNYEAEASVNTKTGNASTGNCDYCSGGSKVGGVYQGSSLAFHEINVSTSGSYTMTVYYISGDPRAANISVNGGEAQNILFDKTVDWSTLGSQIIPINLKAGSNTILFADGGQYSPDFDKIVIAQSQSSNVQACEKVSGDAAAPGEQIAEQSFGAFFHAAEYEHAVVLTGANGQKVTYQLDSGLADYAWNDKIIARGIYSKFGDAASSCYSSHNFSMSDIQPIHDGFGDGVVVKFVNENVDSPTINQLYYFYPEINYFFTRTEVVNETPISTNYLAPLVTNTDRGIDLGSYADDRVLTVPFDNDQWVRYQALSINSSDTSQEVTAIYDNTNRNGLIVGSVSHDTWKTGIHFTGDNNRLNNLELYGGSSSGKTHDTVPHGSLTGTNLWSPMAFVGYFADYRTGLEEYAKANAVITPPLSFSATVPHEVPVGWNSWAAYGSSLSYQNVIDTSDYFKTHLQSNGFANKGNVYINLDSYWDNLSDTQLANAVARIHQNGQKAGIYWAPFVYWGDNMNHFVEGAELYNYGDIVLKDDNGVVLPKLDGAYALDPTNPGTKQRMDYFLNKFKNLGMEYIKLDFLTHGSLEGDHFDPAVQTGIQAYNQGMAYVANIVGDSMFISESIAPLFPSQYGHARRLATDTFGSIADTEYQLNALTYGWWQNGTIYPYTDPDHMALTRANTLTEARSRVNSAVVSGTVFFDSDDVHNTSAQEYLTSLLTKASVLDVVTKGKAFKPVEGNTGSKATDTFVLNDQGTYYLAVFNYSNSAVNKTVNLSRAGLGGSSEYKLTDLWTDQVTGVQGSLNVSLAPTESKLYKLSSVGSMWSSDSHLDVVMGTVNAQLTWSVAQDEHGIESYVVYKDQTLYETVSGNVYGLAVSGLSPGTAYTFTVQAKNLNGEISTDGPSVQAVTGGSNNDNPGNPGSTAPATPGSTVNEPKVTDIPTAVKAGDLSSGIQIQGEKNGISILVMDEGKTLASIASQEKGTNYYAIEVSNPTSNTGISIELNAKIINAALLKGGKDTIIEIISPFGNYKLPLQSLELPLGTKVLIVISKADEATLLKVKAATASGFQVGEVINFEVITTDAGGVSKKVEGFGNIYIERSIHLGAVDPSNLAAVMLMDDGSIVPVPALFEKQTNGTYTAVINRTGNSTYAILTGAKSFADIQGHWAQDSIETMASRLLVNGQTDTSFAPNKSVTRAEFTNQLVRALGLSDRTSVIKFADVTEASWFAEGVAVAASIGLVNGYEDGTFRPNNSISREEIAVLLSRAIVFAQKQVAIGGDLSEYKDASSVASWSLASMQSAVKAGFIQGDQAHRLLPSAQATRAEATVMLARLLRYVQFIN
ncbi:carbohydrate-binding protein [Paenibacillus psychroresistens]|uniref:Carbohydrate-binding protein n=1 Tax=Paenibacillus psychroresistens TaxID=1778678 RepID=A0A6B8RH24_9BACL|nr:S-layer homology domain-containing protein [Paenibacillus psychroresistens]QGQ94686.1 carbohydrate-binding protein [Paenibacillus psychroresistens]